jgi:hypothetical protein
MFFWKICFDMLLPADTINAGTLEPALQDFLLPQSVLKYSNMSTAAYYTSTT